MDKFDIQILNELQQNAKLTNVELADKIGLTPSPCLRRTSALEEAGYIQGYGAILAKEKLGWTITAYLGVELEKHTPDAFQVFEASIQSVSEVISCNLITGQSSDYLLIVVAKNMENYQHILLNKIATIPQVAGLHSSFILKEIKPQCMLPLV